MALAVCLLLDERADTAVRRMWDRLEQQGIASLASHTHGRHVPHLSYASVLEADRDATLAALVRLPARKELTLHLDAFGTFRRSRCWLAPAITPDLASRPGCRGRRRTVHGGCCTSTTSPDTGYRM